MNRQEFLAALDRLDLGQWEIAERGGVTDHAVHVWGRGAKPIPAYAGLYIEALLEIQRLTAENESLLRRLSHHDTVAPGSDGDL